MNKENVLAVADAIENHTFAELGFNMLNFVSDPSPYAPDKSGHGCGTVACIAGWSKAVRESKTIDVYDRVVWRDEAEWLGLAFDDGYELFFGDRRTNNRLQEITPAEASSVLRHLAETGKVDWSIAAQPVSP